MRTCIEEYCLEESLEKELRETFMLPHVHQYQRMYEQHLDHGEKKSLGILTPDEKKSNKSLHSLARLKSDLKKPNETTDDDQSVSIDLDDQLESHPDETV